MNAKEMKIKTFSLIEEYYPEEKTLADDEDIKNKINGVINSIMLDLIKYKKIPAKTTRNIRKENPILKLSSISDLYQINVIPNVEYELIGDYEIMFKIEETKDVEIYYYKYPTLLDLTFETEEDSSNYDDGYEFEFDKDVLEAMPYGIAADLLKNDMISGYGKYFYERYNELKNTLISSKIKNVATITGGYDI